MKIVVINRADGGVSVMSLDGTFDALFEAAHDEHIVEPEIRQWEEVASPAWLPIRGWRILADGERLPSDRAFRNAWIDDGKTIAHDMPKARDIHRDKMRQVRQPLLEALDVKVLRALETGQATTDLVAQKQALRDVTDDPAIEAAKTPGDLEKVWPAALKA